MTDGKYYMDGEEFIHVTGHFIGGEDTPMILVESLTFAHGLHYYERLGYVEKACDRRMVESSEEEFNIVKNLYMSCRKTIDTLNTQWFMPRWKEKEQTKQ